ncbi:superoxide dismutase family protein [Streptomyces sp. NPDC087300]|uniref:superoxide dismutase family protein n=1 Tax=Streptomyces sp. NPDC087300 TaxID=3365780 RepID=UPI0038269E6D
MVAGMVAGAVAAAVLAAGGGAPDGAPAGGDESSVTVAVAADRYWLRAEARFAPPAAFIPSPALTYDQTLVPAASRIRVDQRVDENGTTVSLRVRGLTPGHAYGAHVHQNACGAAPEAAGGHYQDSPDPVQPSKDPAYANPRNEVWLDFTAGADGSGSASARHLWALRPGEAGSVVLHEEPGGAGDRVACFTVPFGSMPGAAAVEQPAA